VENPLPKNRRRTDVHRHPLYYGVRNHIIDFLVSRSRSWRDDSRSFDPRHVPVVRPGAPEPTIAAEAATPLRAASKDDARDAKLSQVSCR
jgi:nitrate/nitrite transport system ATP-binding protein